MSSILMKGVIRNGRVEVAEPIDLPDGSEVIVQVLNGDVDADFEEGWDNSPQGIASWLQWCNALQPLKITPQHEADTEAWLERINQRGTAWERFVIGLASARLVESGT